MPMPEAMTKERLDELLDLAYESVGSPAEKPYGEALSEACSEIERLMAERDCFRKGLEYAIAVLECDCDEAYTKRNRCEPNSLCWLGGALKEDYLEAA